MVQILKCEFTDTGIIVPPEIDSWKLYNFVLQSILDSYLPVTKAIGFTINTPAKLRSQTATKRCSFCLENMVEIATNLDDKIFFGVRNNRVSTMQIGQIRMDKSRFVSNGKEVSTLYTNPVVLTAIKELYLEIFVTTNSGYKSMEDNAKIMNSRKFFPLNAYHNIIDYVRVLPYNGTIRYKLCNGMTKEILRGMYTEFMGMYIAKALEKEVAEWVSSFEE